MNGWRGLNLLPNQEESAILTKNTLLWLLAYSPKSRGDQLLFNHPVFTYLWLTCLILFTDELEIAMSILSLLHFLCDLHICN
jgi:uncharacterized membrane protein